VSGSAEVPASPAPRRRLESSALLGCGSELIISHGGEEYRLRLTRQGKLILTK
jgi:hemin uptake protein HemP